MNALVLCLCRRVHLATDTEIGRLIPCDEVTPGMLWRLNTQYLHSSLELPVYIPRPEVVW